MPVFLYLTGHHSSIQIQGIYIKTEDSYKTQSVSVFLRKITLILLVILMSLLMRKRGHENGNFISSISILLLSDILLLIAGCRNSMGEIEKNQTDGNMLQVTSSGVGPAYVKFRLFQNPDSTWGYTIFVNSRPYLYYGRMPFKNSDSGFPLKDDAEIVAGLIVKMIRNGNLSPKLNKNTLDSLESKIKLKESVR